MENNKPFCRTIYSKSESEKGPDIIDGCVFKKKDDFILKSRYENLVESTQWSEALNYSLRMQVYKYIPASEIEYKKTIRTELMKTDEYIENVKSICSKHHFRLVLNDNGHDFESDNNSAKDAELINQELELLDKQFGKMYAYNMSSYIGYKDEASKHISL